MAWTGLASSLKARTGASGIKAISVLSPDKTTKASRGQWEDRMVKLRSESGRDLSNKMKVAVL